ncbi:MAG: stage III sporulation AC/AD family protein [Oscillospiraceae bacterium]|nr:stage III sporulation AC/AD family protein [Ruminococcus sp.]MDD7338358.1 stage III sporulation AC/AD family protein [Ruminococcus sp.]MDY6060386.1 stage III sporulation AC/AD family protein [Oscillospiraceae bacterium]
MADIVKISVLAVVCTVVTALIKQYAPSYSSLAQIAALVAVLTLGMTFIKDALSSALELMNVSALQSEYIFLLIKALGIAVTAKFAADACRDSGSSSLAGAVELAAKAAILVLTMPMLKALAAAVSGLLGA